MSVTLLLLFSPPVYLFPFLSKEAFLLPWLNDGHLYDLVQLPSSPNPLSASFQLLGYGFTDHTFARAGARVLHGHGPWSPCGEEASAGSAADPPKQVYFTAFFSFMKFNGRKRHGVGSQKENKHLVIYLFCSFRPGKPQLVSLIQHDLHPKLRQSERKWAIQKSPETDKA